MNYYLAIDIGASSGRHIVGWRENNEIKTDEVYRFPNGTKKNIMGMWVVNRLRDELCPNKPFPQIVEGASKSDFTEYVDVNDASFLSPNSMKEAFDYMLKTKPQCDADYFRCAYLSLAISYERKC